MTELRSQYQKELQQFCWDNGFNPDPLRIQSLAFFASLVVTKNQKINLISKRDVDNIIEKHVWISAYISKYIPERVSYFLDIGTGGGFPGIPIAILRPDLKGVLVDATGKKIDAVKEFIDNLKLSNVIAENHRVESKEFIDKYRDSFDLIVSRATVPLIILLRYSLPLIKDRAYLMAMKGGDLEEEFTKAEIKYKSYIRKSTTFELYYKPSNLRNRKGKKLILLELHK
ncbi:MAG: 16S rRNA (guanine(527)-N(7))-methyltransferase RsmG [Ignavibacteriaceae bacterium]